MLILVSTRLSRSFDELEAEMLQGQKLQVFKFDIDYLSVVENAYTCSNTKVENRVYGLG